MKEICDIWDVYYRHVVSMTTANESHSRVIAATAMTILHVFTRGRDDDWQGVVERSVDFSEKPGPFPSPGSTR